jgi:hypothetical protein
MNVDAGAPSPTDVRTDRADRNQRWLSAQFARWREALDVAEGDSPIAGGVRARRERLSMDEPWRDTPTAHLRDVFGLTSFETELLVLAAGLELDLALGAAIARRQPTGDRFGVDFALALELLPDPHWDALSPLGALRHWALVSVDLSAGLARARLRIDERILHHLTGVAAFDDRLTGIASIDEGDEDWRQRDEVASLAGTIARAMRGSPPPLVALSDGRPESAAQGRELVRAVFATAGRRTLWVRVSALPHDPREAVDVARRLDRESALTGAGVAVLCDTEPQASLLVARLVEAVRGPLVLLGAGSPVAGIVGRRLLRYAVPHHDASIATRWPKALQRAAEPALHQFRVEPDLLDQVLVGVDEHQDRALVERDVWDALREAARGGLDALAQRIESRTTFDDVVAPAHVTRQLIEIASQLRCRQIVYDTWGFGQRDRRGLGIAALFAGESGTGKTLAAEAIANEARLDLYRIDLASLVSKYIGETEKNLAKLFDAAERSGAVLLFDEADALFGKRSEVKDSHDRYANIEVAYLLQRIELYRGLAILTTNVKSALDRAFVRRIRFIVQFPFPDEGARQEIWRRQFPHEAPLADADFQALARLPLSGGHIRSVAVNAAFSAAGRSQPITQAALIDAARAEFAKLERPFVAGVTGGAA